MAESQLAETSSEVTNIAHHVGRMSDRAIQRLVGGNAFLRGRIYARRNAVTELNAAGMSASCSVVVRADEPIAVQTEVAENGELTSQCGCQAWRGPTGHCKHVAALLVALRDRERPPKQKAAPAPVAETSAVDLASPIGAVATAGGKRRRSRRRRRGAAEIPAVTNGTAKVEMLSVRQLGLAQNRQAPVARDGLDAWLPQGEVPPKPCEFEYRLTVRAASLNITPVLAGTRSAVPIADALAGFNTVPGPERGLLRALARHAPRGTPATAEVRGEDAAEVLSMLNGRRVLLEPASKELRFTDERLKPRIELDLANNQSLRVRVVFESGSRRFPLSSGAWFEGTPGWHIDTTEGVARPVTEAVTPAWLQRLYRSPALVHPLSDMPRMLTEYIPKVATSLGTELPELSTIADIVDETPKMQLKAGGELIRATVRLRVVYDGEEYPVPTNGFPSPLAFLPPLDGEARPRVVRRDVGAEMTGVQELMNLGFTPGPEGDELIAEGDAAVAFWTTGIASLPKDWDKFIPDDLVNVKIRAHSVTPRARVSSGVDWLSLDLTFEADGIAIDETELRMCLEHGRHLVKLTDGSYAPVKANEVGEILERMAEIYASDDPTKRIPMSQAGRVQDLLRLVSRPTVSSTAKDLFGKLENIGEIEQQTKPRSLKATMRPYQREGFSWLAFLHNLGTGGILADDMGLGKTLQAIALLLWVKSKSKKHQMHLVVAPTSVVPNWQNEIQKFAPNLKVVLWHGPDRHALANTLEEVDVMITSYALLRRDEELLTKLGFGYLILDEAQHIKNPVSATARSAKRLSSERRLAMTGTPIENRLSEIWSIFDFVAPGMLGGLTQFEERFARPIERGDKEAAEKLRAAIHRFVLRRTKSEVAKDLPAKIEQDMLVPLADEQAKLYKQMVKQIRDSVMSEVEKQGVAKAQIQILAALTRLRQVACDPRLTKLEGSWDEEESGKVSALREIVQEAVAGGHRILIFSQFVEMLKLIKKALDADGVTYEYLDGSTKDRAERVANFNGNENISAFLVSLKAGGTGLNLTGADTVIHFDPWWNPAVEDQATDRAHRIGQTRVVSVYRLIARDTVEEKIQQLSSKKRELVANVLATDGPTKGLTKADLEELFS